MDREKGDTVSQVDLSRLQERAKKAIEALSASVDLDVDDHVRFIYAAPGDGVPDREISSKAFFADDAPPGVYTFQVLDDEGNATSTAQGVKYEMFERDADSKGRDPFKAIPQGASILIHNATAETTRMAIRLEAEEKKNDVLKARLETIEAANRTKDREIAELTAQIEELEDNDEMGELASVVGPILLRVLGWDTETTTEEDAEAVGRVVEIVRQEKAVQRAVARAKGGAAAMRQLGIGRKEEGEE